jgi:16S rRNA (guanine527-N7)-methyltransferase
MVPQGINTLLEFGSGAGFPGLPIALCRPEIAVTLAESQGKKAAFLQEVIRTLSIPVTVHAGRAEDFRSKFDCVVLRAVDKMPRAVVAASKLVGRQGWLGLMTTLADVAELKLAAGSEYRWDSPAPLPGTERKIMTFGNKAP